MIENYDLLPFPLEKNLYKEIWPLDPFYLAINFIGIRQVINLLGKDISQPTPPIQGMLQLWGAVFIAISPDKFYQYQV